MSLGINNDQGLNIREESRFVWLDTFNYIQDTVVRLFHKILFPDCDSRLVMLMYPNMD